MALIECRECKHQISDQAQACPNCGAPVHPAAAAAPAPAAAPAAPRNNGMRTVLVAIVVLVVAFLAYRIWNPTLQKAGIVPSARFAVDNAGGTEACTTLGDYCVRVLCAVTNIGDANGIARVAADFSEDSKVVATHRGTTQMLVPGQHDTLTLDFPEATLASTQHQYRCYPEQ